MPYETYHCCTCRTAYAKHAEAVRCERRNHRPRTVWPSKASQHPDDTREATKRDSADATEPNHHPGLGGGE
jgi:hypothetical protein